MSSPFLPPPPQPDELTLLWLASDAAKRTLAAYMAAVYAHDNLQVVVIKNGVRQPPVAIKTGASPAIIEITV